MDTGDLIMFGVIGYAGYLFYQHQQAAASSTAAAIGPTGAVTGSVQHQCPQGYDWVPDSSAAGGACVAKQPTSTVATIT
jgi:hypothetical protein